MRLRTLKPGFFKNEDLVELSPLTRLLFAGLWCMADREGRLQDRPGRIKLELLPGDNCDVDELLTGLEQHGFILRYEVDGQRLIQVLKFRTHQNPHVKEPDSILPAPGQNGVSDSEAPGLHSTDTVPAPGENGATTMPAPPDYSSLGSGLLGFGETTLLNPPASGRTVEQLEELFEEFDVPDDATAAHDLVMAHLDARGFVCRREIRVPSRGDYQAGHVDVFAEHADGNLAIEIDRRTPRKKSITKLRQVENAQRVILLRLAPEDPPPHQLPDIAVIGLWCPDAPQRRGSARRTGRPKPQRDQVERERLDAIEAECPSCHQVVNGHGYGHSQEFNKQHRRDDPSTGPPVIDCPLLWRPPDQWPTGPPGRSSDSAASNEAPKSEHHDDQPTKQVPAGGGPDETETTT